MFQPRMWLSLHLQIAGNPTSPENLAFHTLNMGVKPKRKEMFGWYLKSPYLCTRIQKQTNV